MTYPEAIEFLYDLRWHGVKFGLDNTRRLAAQVGQPQDRLRFIHVAGTNGKGSTCAMLESIYRAAGLRVALFTSPHLVSFRERIQVNRRLIGEADVVRLVAKLRHAAAVSLSSGEPAEAPTFFEFVTVMALCYFAEQNCDLVIWETGLGGRLDATNIVTPLASVITNIGLDHQQWLGDTLEQIAAEKAGIIKPSVPVLTAVQQPQALAVFQRVADEQRAPLTIAHPANPPLSVALAGEHQKANAVLAAATVRALRNIIPVGEEQIESGLARVDWPGRLQILRRSRGREVVLDGAHNPAGAEALATALRSLYPGRALALVFGVLRDKDWCGIVQPLVPLATRILLTPVSNSRSESPSELVEFCRRLNPAAAVAACSSLTEALQSLESEPLVVVSGSLYLVGEALEYLQPDGPTLSTDEKALNDWGAVSQPPRVSSR